MTPEQVGLAPEARIALLADQRARWLNGQSIGVESYLVLDPSIVQDPDLVLDLIAQEAWLNRRQIDDARLHDLIRRFPGLAASIRDQFLIERFLGGILGIGPDY